MKPRRFWLCADDYGISPAVNRAIRDLIGRRRVNATSVMVGAPSFDAGEARSLAALAAENAGTAALGLHFTTAPSLLGSYRPIAADGRSCRCKCSRAARTRLTAPPLPRKRAPDRGVPPGIGDRDFVDGHQHVHLCRRSATRCSR
jgi:predicted glycoside hydrolase/deacetylase ChbG (UPF0249 family)